MVHGVEAQDLTENLIVTKSRSTIIWLFIIQYSSLFDSSSSELELFDRGAGGALVTLTFPLLSNNGS